MSFTRLLTDYGYLAVFAGCLLEGETILLLAGFAAHQGHLSLPLVLTIAFIGGALGDQVFYWAGRAWGTSLLGRIPGFHARAARVIALLKRHDALLIVGIRFMYGLRIVGPIAMGAVGLSPRRFSVFNLVGAAIWAPLVGGVGYLFGHAVEALLGDVARFEEVALALIVAVAVLFALIHAWLRRARSKSKDPDR
jgi:membrane protein DedA with SNARE-associated domain